MQVQYKVNEAYLCQFPHETEPSIYVIDEVVEQFVHIYKYKGHTDKWMQGKDFHEAVKVKYGVLREKKYLFFFTRTVIVR